MAVKPLLSTSRSQLVLVLCLFGALALVFFFQVLGPGQVFSSNDGPVGQLNAASHRLPARFTGCWEDLNTVGYREGAATPNISFFLQWVLGPVLFSKFYVPISIVILGLSAWAFFRELKLAASACILGGVAAMLNSTFFSVACWGIAAHTLTFAMTFLALAALTDMTSPRRWLRTALAGLCVGMGVAEGADVGALCSIFVVLYVIYQSLTAEGSRAKNVLYGAGRVAAVAICAALLAACAVSELVNNDIKDIPGAKQDASTRAERWNWATQWSLPKREALSIIVPGLFGYRFDATDGTQYWGAIGQAAEWEDYFSKGSQGPTPGDKYVRCSATGYYPGALALVLALWAVVESLRKQTIFSSTQRRWIWFWAAVIVVSLLFAFGRYAPFYHYLYVLPYFSTIRNPIKFLYFLSMAFVVLFSFGVDGLWRGFVNQAPADKKRLKAGRFENLWLFGSLVAIVLSLIGLVVYSTYRGSVEKYLQTVLFDSDASHTISAYSFRQVAFFVAFLAAAAALVNLALRRFFSAKSTAWAAGMFGLLLVLDLGCADRPWIVFLDYRDQNATNPIIDSLRGKSYEHRVALLPLKSASGPTVLDKMYRADWILHQFPFYDIQSLDIAQLPRMPQDIAAFNRKFDSSPESIIRKWQLTNTRYLIGNADLMTFVSNTMHQEQPPLRYATRFKVVSRPGVLNVSKVWDLTAVPDDAGQFAVIEFTHALPRAALYSQWQISSNATAALDQIADLSFDPEQTVIVTGDGPAPTPKTGTSQNAGTVAIESYAPKRIELKADATAPAVLLLNDRFDPNWKVSVDGQPQPLLRCNYLMRGVYLTSGSHKVEFRFAPPSWPLYISLATLGAGILLIGFVLATPSRKEPLPQRTAPKRDYVPASVNSR